VQGAWLGVERAAVWAGGRVGGWRRCVGGGGGGAHGGEDACSSGEGGGGSEKSAGRHEGEPSEVREGGLELAEIAAAGTPGYAAAEGG
jgi:hypothetical protein